MAFYFLDNCLYSLVKVLLLTYLHT